jgi:Family of unknown function (DUF5719)
VNRTTLSLIGGVAALAAVFGVASAAEPAPSGAPGANAVRKPIQRSTLLCPAPTDSDYDSSTYTAYTPPGTTPASGGTARLFPGEVSDGDSTQAKPPANAKPVAPVTTPGKPATANSGKTTYPLIGSADGALAPGWSVQETTTIDAGAGRGLLGTACGPAGTDFWFPAASTATHRADYVHLTNPDQTAAVADIELYNAKGSVSAPGGQGITVPGDSSVPILLSTLTGDQSPDVTVHVEARTGRVGAVVQAMDTTAGGDWLPPCATPADSAVLPGIPKDASSVELVGYPTGGNDADLKVQLLTSTGPITPAGHETVQLRSGMTTAVDLPKLTQGQPGTLVLTPADPGQSAPFVAALRVTRGKGGDEETAFIPATGPVGQRATAADNRTKGSTISLTAPGASATVRITSSATSSGGTPVSQTVTVKGGTTKAIAPPAPNGKGTFAVTVEPLSGGDVYASRELADSQYGVPAFTIQDMPDDGGMVAVPDAEQNLSVLER